MSKIYGDTVGGGGLNLKKIPQSDWNQTDETKKDYIKNKPDIDGMIGAANEAVLGAIDEHAKKTDNPHEVTKEQIGLGAVVNTGDSEMPVAGGTTKFTTGGAYTELNKKIDKTGGTISGDLVITGDLTVSGKTISEDRQAIVAEDNMIIINSNKVDLQTAVSGLAINKNKLSTYGAVYDPTDDTFKFGEGTLSEDNEFSFNEGEGLPFAVRDDSSKFVNGDLVQWSTDGNKLVNSGKDASKIAFIDSTVNENVDITDVSLSEVIVDSHMSTRSINPVQNKVVTQAINDVEEKINNITFSDVGAVPITRKVNNKELFEDVNLVYSDVGAAPVEHGNHVPTIQEADDKMFLRNDNTWQKVMPDNIGAVPTNRTINDKELTDNVVLTAEDVAAAPAGFGLGEESAPLITSEEELNSTVKSGFYRIFISGKVWGNTGITANGGSMIVSGVIAERTNQIVFIQNTNYVVKRYMYNGTWSDWVDCSPSAFAPAGYGYGDMPKKILDTADDATGSLLESALENELAKMSNSTVKQIMFYAYPNIPGGYCIGTFHRHDANNAVLTGVNYNTSAGSFVKRKYNGVWNPLEWVNPPMIDNGTEYRTTERWNGNPVYTKVVNFGLLPSQSNKSVNIGIKSYCVIDITGFVYDGSGETLNMLPSFYGSSLDVNFYVNIGGELVVETRRNLTNCEAKFTVKYVK